MSKEINELIVDIEQDVDLEGNTLVVNADNKVDGNGVTIRPIDHLEDGDIVVTYTAPTFSSSVPDPDNPETNAGTVGTAPDTINMTQPTGIITPTYVTVQRTIDRKITDYSAGYLQAYQREGAKAIAKFKDGTEREVSWSEVFDPRPSMEVHTFQAATIAEASNQHFWTDVNGAHVTDNSQDDWKTEYNKVLHGNLANPPGSTSWHNILINSLGILLRRGLLNLAAITRGSITFYDGAGNNTSNITAAFGDDGVQIGKSTDTHLIINSNAINVYNGDGTLASLHSANIDADHAAIIDLDASTAKIQNGYIINANIHEANVENLTTDYAHITRSETGLALIDNARITHLAVEGLNANYAHMTSGVIDNATIDQADVNNLSTNYAHITNGVIDNASISHANVNDLSANYAHITNGIVDNAKIGYADVNGLSAHYAEIENGVIKTATIGHAQVNGLAANYAKVNMENVNNSWIENGVIKNAAITSAQIAGVSANKITAGTINAETVNITNLQAENIKVKKINSVNVTGKSVADALATHEEDISDLEDYVNDSIDDLNARIDAQIETYTSTEIPTASNYPASSWQNSIERAKHVGDICYVINPNSNSDGFTYRYAYDNTNDSYGWILIQDNQITAALARLQTAEGKINGLESFESSTTTWINETDQGLTTIRNNHTSLVGRVDKTLISTTQLWITRAINTPPTKPGNSEVTLNNVNTPNQWNIALPKYNSSYPEYYYCFEWKYADGTINHSEPTLDTSAGETQELSRQNAEYSEQIQAELRASDPLVCGTQTSTTYYWTGVCEDITELVDGQKITYFLPYNCAGTQYSYPYVTISDNSSKNTTGACLNLTLANGVQTGEIPIWYGGITRVTTHYTYGSMIHLTYRVNPVLNGTYRIGHGWIADANYNTNDNTIYSRSITGGFISGANGTGSYILHMRDANDRWTKIVDVCNVGNVTKHVYTGGLKYDEVLYNTTYYGTSIDMVRNTPGESVSGDLWTSYVLDFRYSTTIYANSVAGKKLTTRQPVYLVGVIGSDKLFYLDTTQWWTQTLPSSKDGKVYIYLGLAYSWYQLTLVDRKQAFIHNGVEIVEYGRYLSDEAQDTADEANDRAKSTIKSATQLWYTQASATPLPNAPSSVVSVSQPISGWSIQVPEYNTNKPHYFYCYQYQKGDDTYAWSSVVYDKATSDAGTTIAATTRDLADYISSNDDAISELQNQIDSQLEVWYNSSDPTTSNSPANTWTTNSMKDSHVGDLYYNTSDGSVWQYIKTNEVYSWSKLPDNAASNALAAAQDAQATADGKRRIFTTTPTVPYDIGDLWINSGTNGKEVKYATVAKTSSQTYAASDWTVTATDNTVANKNAKEVIQLWFTKANTTAPSKPSGTSPITSTSTDGNAWRVVVPTYNSSYPYYFYCYQYKAADGTYTWSNVVYDQATTETQKTARDAEVSAGTANDKIDNLEIGISNLIRNGDFTNGFNYWTKEGSGTTIAIENDSKYGKVLKLTLTNTGAGYRIYPNVTDNFTHVAGKKYALSFYAKSADTTNIRVGVMAETPNYINESLTNTWTRYTASITAPSSGSITFRTSSAATVYLAKIMLVYGDKCMEWAPNELDIADSISSVNTIAKAAITEAVQLWCTKSDDTPMPTVPSSAVTGSNVVDGWSIAVPKYNGNTPHYFYCYQYKNGNNAYTYSSVVYDKATSDSGSTLAATSASLADYISSNDDAIEALQNQIDNQMEIWYYGTDPSVSTAPASSWTTNDIKDAHLGDLYYNTETGSAWRYFKNGNTYEWTLIPQTEAQAALAAAQAAQATADGKRRIFTTTPTVPYDIGDLWINSGTNGKEVKYATVAKTSSQTYAASDWTVTATDNTVANKNAKEVIQLWFTKANTTAPSKPSGTSPITSTSTDGNAWRVVVPTYNSSYPYYFYCYQYKAADGTYTWSNVVYDQATTETQKTARDAEVSAGTANDKIDNLEIGGRNLLRNTKNEKSQAATNTAIPSWTFAFSGKLPTGIYTISFDVKSSNGTDNVYFSIANNTSTQQLIDSITPTTEYARYSKTFEYTKTSNSNCFFFTSYRGHNYTGAKPNSSNSGTVYFKNVKLEIGNKATDWTPAPEDVDDSISSVNTIAKAAITEAVQLWCTKSDDTPIPTVPSSAVTGSNIIDGWSIAVPEYNGNTPHYFYCYQYKNGNNAYTYSSVVYDKATSDSGSILAATSSSLADYISSNDDAIEALQNQIDNQLEVWYGSTDPSSSSAPANTWDTNTVKDSHVGDLWYNTSDGSVWQYVKNNDAYSWSKLPDSAASSALAAAQAAQATADGKRRIFTTTPTVPYDIGDLWINSGTNGKEVKYATVAKTSSQTYAASDWTVTATDNTVANKNAKEVIQLWFTKANTTAPNKPSGTSPITSTSTDGNAWRVVVPTYNSSYPYYFYCYQYKAADGTYTWSNVVYDQATTETQKTARDAEVSAGTANDKIDNLEIGGRNLLLGTSGEQQGSGSILCPWLTSNAFKLLSIGDTITVSFDVKSTMDQWIDAYFRNAPNGISGGVGYVTNDFFTDAIHIEEVDIWYHVIYTGVIGTNFINYNYFAVRSNGSAHGGATNMGVVTVRNLKLERGNKPTDWTPAPEDVEASISTAQNTANLNVRSSIQLWFTKSNNTAPNKPTSINQVSNSASTSNSWNKQVPTYNSSYPYYFYCWQYEAANGTYTWSDPVYDSATSEVQKTARDAETLAKSTIKESIQIWCVKSASSPVPYAPNSAVTGSNSVSGWTITVPEYDSSNPHYFYCYQYKKGDNTYSWSDVVYDKTTSDSGSNLAATSASLSDYITSNNTAMQSLQNQVDNQIEIWYYATNPSNSSEPVTLWTTTAKKDAHLGDLYYNTETGSAWRYFKNGDTYEWTLIPQTEAQAALAAAQAAQATADGKRRIFTTTPTVPYDIGDLWINSGTNGKEVKYATVAKTSSQTYAASDWTVTATDNTVANKNAKEVIQLWFTKANTTAPSKPSGTSPITSTSTDGNAWRVVVPTYNSSYPYYFYCYQYKAADGTYTWSNVVYDQATTETQKTARDAENAANTANTLLGGIVLGGQGRWYASHPREITEQTLGYLSDKKYIQLDDVENFDIDFVMRVDASVTSSARYALATPYSAKPLINIELTAGFALRFYCISTNNILTDKSYNVGITSNVPFTIIVWYNHTTTDITYLVSHDGTFVRGTLHMNGVFTGLSNKRMRLGADDRVDNTWNHASPQMDQPSLWYAEPPQNAEYLCYWDLSTDVEGNPISVSPITYTASTGIITSVNAHLNNVEAKADSSTAEIKQLWFTKANSTAPGKPQNISEIVNSSTTPNKWNQAVPVYNETYPHYFYCYQRKKIDDTYEWTDVVYDAATSENEQNSHQALTTLTTKVDVDVFDEVVDEVGQHSTSITSLSTIADILDKESIEYIVATNGSTATNIWTGTTRSTTLYVGKTIALKTSSAGTSSAAVLKLTLGDGTQTANIPLRRNGSTVTTQFPAGSVITMTYDGTYWRITGMGSDTDTNTYNRIRYENNVLVLEQPGGTWRLICGTINGYKKIAINIEFDLSYPILALSNNPENNTNSNNGYLMVNSLPYTNTANVESAGVGKMLYLKGSVSDKIFTCDTLNVFTTVIPNTQDNKFYIPLGIIASVDSSTGAVVGYFSSSSELWAYTDGKFQKATPMTITTQNVVNQVKQTANENSASITSLTNITDNLSLFNNGHVGYWRIDRYYRPSNIDSATIVPTFNDFKADNFIETIYKSDDNFNKNWNIDKYYIAKAYTYIYMSDDTTISTYAYSDDYGALYINNILIWQRPTNTQFTFVLTKGWNKIEFLLNEQLGSDYARFISDSASGSSAVSITTFDNYVKHQADLPIFDNTLTESKVSEIKQTLDGFQTTVSSTYATQQSLTELSNSVEDIQIGGRNLSLSTATPKELNRTNSSNNYFYPLANYQLSDYGMTQVADLSNEKFTVSFNWHAVNVETEFDIRVSLYNGSAYVQGNDVIETGNRHVSVGSSSGNYIKTFSPTSDMRSSTNKKGWLFGGVPANTNANATVTITNFKFEVGNKTTSWTPAPEDVDTAAQGYASTAESNAKTAAQGYADAVDGRLTQEVNKRKAIYATCSTAAGTAAKVATCSNFELFTGAKVTVIFTNMNTAASPTLKIGDSVAKAIRSFTGAALTEAEYKWDQGAVIDFVYDGTYWRMTDLGVKKRVVQAETQISQNAEAILLRATKSEAIELVQPNLTPMFSSHNANGTYPNCGVGGYWQNTTDNDNNRSFYTALENGWIHASISGVAHGGEFAPPRISELSSGEVVTVLTEWRNVTSSDNVSIYTRNYIQSCQLNVNTYLYRSLRDGLGSGHRYDVMTVNGDAVGSASWNALVDVYVNHKDSGNIILEGDFRISFYKGTYDGPYKPYVGELLYSSQAELKVANDAISTKVEKNGVISSINQSSESITINANRVNIEGATIFSSGRLSQTSLNNAYDSKGAASTAESNAKTAAQGYASTAESNAKTAAQGYASTAESNAKTAAQGYASTAESNAKTAAQGYASTAKSEAISSANSTTDTKLTDYSTTTQMNSAIENAVDDISIGGRNLFSWPVSGTKWKDEEHELKPYQNTGSYSTFTNSLLFDPSETVGEQYTISFEAKSPNGITSVWVYNVNSKPLYFNFNFIQFNDIGDEWIKCVTTVTNKQYTGTPGSASNNEAIWRRLEVYAPEQTGVLIRKIKVEKGNKATDWTPAPEDVEASILAVENQIPDVSDFVTQTDIDNTIDGNKLLWYATCDTAAATVAKVATITPSTSNFVLQAGVAVNIKFSITNTGAVGSLTLSVNGTTAKNIKYINNGGAPADLPGAGYLRAGNTYQFIYDGTYWIMQLNFTNAADTFMARYVQYYNTIKAGAAIGKERIIGGRSNGLFYQMTENSSFDLAYPLLWCTVDIAANGTNYANIYMTCYDRNLATGYPSFVNTTANALVYLVGTINGNTFTTYGSSSAQYLTVNPPTEENGLIYIPVGRTGNQSNGKNYFNYFTSVPVSLYAYLDGKFRQVTPSEIVAEQDIYCSKADGTSSLNENLIWVTDRNGGQNGWTAKRPQYNQSYPVLFIAHQAKRLDGTVTCTTPMIDDTTTIIDGGRIITGSVTANKLNAADINASKSLTVGAFTDNDCNDILNSNIEIGGRNLSLSTATPKELNRTNSSNNYFYPLANYQLSDYGMTQVADLSNEKFTVSFNWHAVNVETEFDIRVSLYNGSAYVQGNDVIETGNRHVSVGSSSGNYIKTFSPTSDMRSSTNKKGWLFGGVPANTNANATVTITNFKFEVGNKTTSWTPAPEDINDDILEASKIASTYITHIDDNGISIHPKSDTNGTSNYAKINASGLELYKGGNSIAAFTDISARIGKANGARFNMGATSLEAYNSSNQKYFEVTATGLKFGNNLGSTVATTNDISTLTTNLSTEITQRKAIFAKSTTAAGTAAKVTETNTPDGFVLYTGATVQIQFTTANTATTPTLNVNGTGAKTIKSYTGAALTVAEYKWAANAILTLTYDGTYWRIQDGGALQAKADAQSSATSASNSASTASNQASAASTSATNAANSATTASNQASAASTSATNAANSATTASNQASAASTSATNAANSATTASNQASAASTSATNAANSASAASGSATEAANSAVAAKEVMGGYTILWNYSAYGTANPGEAYVCAFDPSTGQMSDANGWVKFNGVKRTMIKGMINPDTILPYNIPIYIVHRLSSASATSGGTNYMVWYDSGWKYSVAQPSAVGGDWTWTADRDIILGKFVEPSSDAAFTECEIYNPPLTSKHVTTNTVTSVGANALATTANTTANTAKNTADLARAQQTVKDTRNDNQTPAWYITTYATTHREIKEFKYANKIGVSTSATYGILITKIPWYDKSGGYPKQTFEWNGRQYWRQGTSGTAWSDWVDAYGTAVNSAKTATDNLMNMSSGGLKIHLASDTTATSDFALLDSNGLDITKAGTSIAQFKGAGSRIGDASASHFVMEAAKLEAYNASNQKYFEVSETGIKFGSNLGSTVATTNDIPTNVSDLTNDSGFITNASIPDVSDFVTQTDIDNSINDILIGGRNLIAFATSLDTINLPSVGSSYVNTKSSCVITREANGWIHISGTIASLSNSAQPIIFGSTDTSYHYIDDCETCIITVEENGLTNVLGNLIYINVYGNKIGSSSTGPIAAIKSAQSLVFTNINYISRVSLIMNSGASGMVIDGRIRFKLEKGNKPTDWTPAPEDAEAYADTVKSEMQTELNNTRSWYAECSTAAATADKVATIVPATTATFNLVAGATVHVKFSETNSAAVASLTLSINGSTPKSIKWVNNNAAPANLPGAGYLKAATTYDFIYDGTYWLWRSNYYVDNNYYNRTNHSLAIKADSAISKAYLICGTSTGYHNLAGSVSFDISYPILWASAAITANATATTTYEVYPITLNATNTAVPESATAYSTVYVKGTLNGTTFTTVSSNFLTCVLPTSSTSTDSNGNLYVYIPLGVMATTTTCFFTSSKNLYAFVDGKFRQVTPSDIIGIQDVYYSTTIGMATLTSTIVNQLATWITNNTNNTQSTWTTVRPQYDTTKPVLFKAQQSKRLDGGIVYTTPKIDDTLLILPGGNLVANSVTANALAANSVTANALDATTINASNKLTIGALATTTQNDILNSTYITNIDNNGIKIHALSDSAGTNNYLKLNADGMEIYKNTKKVASFGDIVTLGSSDSGPELNMSDNSLDLLWGEYSAFNVITKGAVGKVFEAQIYVDKDSPRITCSGSTSIIDLPYLSGPNSSYSTTGTTKPTVTLYSAGTQQTTTIDASKITAVKISSTKHIDGGYTRITISGYPLDMYQNGSYFRVVFYAHSKCYGSITAGDRSEVSSVGGIAIGYVCYVTGKFSQSFGYNCKTNGDYSFAANYGSKADGNYSAVFGVINEANYDGMFVCGYYARTDVSCIFEIGAGSSSSSRKNILTAFSNTVYINGTTTTNGTAVTSDERVKTFIGEISPTEGYSFIKNLKPKKYYKEGKKEVGFYAQDIESDEVFGEYLVSIDNSGLYELSDYRLLNYQGIIAPLVASVQDLQNKNEQLNDEINELNDTVKMLESKNQELEERIARLEKLLLKED